MTAAEWLKSKDGEAMLPLVADRLTPRKWALLACALARRVLHLLPTQPYHEAVAFTEQTLFTHVNDAAALWEQRLDDAEESARDLARDRQREAVKAFDVETERGTLTRDGDDGEPAERVFAAANRYAAESVATAVIATEFASQALIHLFGSVGADRLERVREWVRIAQARAAEVGVFAMFASDLADKADQLAHRHASRRRNLQFSIADSMVNEAVDEIERRLGRVNQEKVNSENAALAHLLREQLGNPFQPYRFEPAWRSETALALAAGIDADRAFDRTPILADAVEEAGCDERPMLDHLRGPGPHARGCWVLDLILTREPELFSQPPITSTPRRMQLGPFTPPPDGMA